MHISTCTAQQIEDIFIPQITGAPEFFDPNNFTEESNWGELEKVNKDTGAKYFYKSSGTYTESDKDRKAIVKYTRYSSLGEFYGYVYPFHSLIGIRKEFYKSGQLKRKGLFYYFSFSSCKIWKIISSFLLLRTQSICVICFFSSKSKIYF